MKTSFKFVAAKDGGVEILVYDRIGDTFLGDGLTAKNFSAELGKHKKQDLTVRVNSPGGSVFDGLTMYHALTEHEGKVTVVVDGLAASIASIIAMAGEEIIVKEGALFMIHNPWGMTIGNADDLRKEADVLEKLGSSLADIYVRRSEQDKDGILKMMSEETWFTAQEAVDFGFADKVENSFSPSEPDEDEDESVAAALRSGEPEQLLKTWDLSGVFVNCPESCSGGSRRLSFAKQRPNSRAKVLAQMRGFFSTSPADAGIPAKAKQETRSMKTKLQLMAAVVSENDPTKKAALLRKLSVHKDCSEDEQALYEEQAVAMEAQASKNAAANTYDKEAELQRRATVRQAFAPFGDTYAKLREDCLDDLDCTVDDARTKLLAAMGKTAKPIAGDSVIIAGEDQLDKFREGAAQTLAARAGLEKHDPKNEFGSYSLRELARLSLSKGGKVAHSDPLQMVGAAFSTTSDFPAILENVMNKSLLKGYTEAPETFEQWTTRGTLSDFKPASRVGTSEFSNLELVPEAGEYKYGTVSDRKETIQLLTYGKLFGLSRQAIINDDLSAFTTVPRKMGRAARRKIGDLVYAVLTGNPVMADGVALFHADHDNVGTGALSAANLDAARTIMALQRDPSGNANLNIRPKYLIVPEALLGKASTIIASETDPDSGNSNSKKPNSVRNMATVISDSRLDSDSAVKFYLAADAAIHDTIEVAYLNGVDTPFMEQQVGWNVDGSTWKVRIDAAVQALEHRTMFRSTGA